MSDNEKFDGFTFSEDEIAGEMRTLNNEFREWLVTGGFERDMRAQARERLKAKQEGRLVEAKERAEYERVFTPEANPAHVRSLNERLEALLALPHRNAEQERERKQLMRELTENFNKRR